MNIKELFYLQKADRKALFFILGLAVAAGIVFWAVSDKPPKDNTPVAASPTKTFKHREARFRHSENTYYAVESTPVHLSKFDPNTADSTRLLALGLQPWQVRSIYRYRAKGGVFRQPSDFARLYGLTKKQYRMLEPFIVIGDDYRPAAELVSEHTRRSADTLRFSPKMKAGERLSLNTADTTALKRVPGIGSYYAKEVVRYRARLGGYIAVEQLKEIEDFPVEALPYFVLAGGGVQKLRVNTLSLNQLKRHPYMGFYRARAILDFRRLKGNVKSLAELRLLKEFSPADIARLEPYLDFGVGL